MIDFWSQKVSGNVDAWLLYFYKNELDYKFNFQFIHTYNVLLKKSKEMNMKSSFFQSSLNLFALRTRRGPFSTLIFWLEPQLLFLWLSSASLALSAIRLVSSNIPLTEEILPGRSLNGGKKGKIYKIYRMFILIKLPYS